MAYFVTLTYRNLFKQTLLPSPNLSPYFMFQLKPVLKVHIGPQKSAIDDWLNSFPRTSKNCKRNQLWCSISHSPEWQLSLRLLQRWSKAEAGHLGDKTWNYKVSNEQIAISTLLLQACFRKQKIPDELSGVFWKARQMAHLRTEFGSICSREGGWLQLPRKQTLNMCFLEFFMLLSWKGS